MKLPDPIAQGLSAGWAVTDASALDNDLVLHADAVIVGSGAGGGMAAELLSAAGLSVVMLEEGGLYSSSRFPLREDQAYPWLYQESGMRQTADKGVTILQGRTVGGGTTVNWTSSFRTPAQTLAWWRDEMGLKSLGEAELAPWFARAEALVNVSDWSTDPNPNNGVLERGCRALGLRHARIRRNVKGCWNLGYCGLGCPTNAKQGTLLTAIAASLARGMRLVTRVRALHVEHDGRRARGVVAQAMQADGVRPSGRRVTVHAAQVVLAAGAIGTPALLLRSSVPDPYHQLGRRTFLHPVALSGALMPERVEPFNGAPQTVYSDHFMHTQPLHGPLGYKLEVPPVHPLLAATTLCGLGPAHAALMAQLPHLNVTLALLRDGFHPESRGGQVKLRGDGSPLLDYPLNDVVWDGVRRAWLSMAELQFAAGARQVMVMHEEATPVASWQQARAQIMALRLAPALARVVSAHVMGGAAMGPGDDAGVVDHLGRHWQLDGLTVVDGSVFPTSVGANPQLSIYAFALRAADALVGRMRR